jgi:hypothetical protein
MAGGRKSWVDCGQASWKQVCLGSVVINLTKPNALPFALDVLVPRATRRASATCAKNR